MPNLDRRIIAAGFVVVAGISLVMAHGVARDNQISEVNTSVAQPTPVPATATTLTVAATRDANVEIVIAGSDPDPESLDATDLESWWKKYQSNVGLRWSP